MRSVGAAVTVAAFLGYARAGAQQPGAGRAGQPVTPAPTLGLEHGTLDFDTPAFTLKLVKDSQTIAALQPKGTKGRDANTADGARRARHSAATLPDDGAAERKIDCITTP